MTIYLTQVPPYITLCAFLLKRIFSIIFELLNRLKDIIWSWCGSAYFVRSCQLSKTFQQFPQFLIVSPKRICATSAVHKTPANNISVKERIPVASAFTHIHRALEARGSVFPKRTLQKGRMASVASNWCSQTQHCINSTQICKISVNLIKKFL